MSGPERGHKLREVMNRIHAEQDAAGVSVSDEETGEIVDNALAEVRRELRDDAERRDP